MWSPRRLHDLCFRLAKDATGAMTLFGLFVFLTMAVIGGLAIDVSHVHAEGVRLQVMADAASAAKAEAVAMVRASDPAAERGDQLLASDISFGVFDYATGGFVADPSKGMAVRVSTARLAARDNAVISFLTQLIGFDSWDISREAGFVAYNPGCSEEGFLS